MNGPLRLATLATLLSSLVACVYDNHSPRHLDGSGPPTPGAPVGAGTSAPPPTPSTQAPMLVDVDTGQTMTADPGKGVGVFIEYAAGGKWHIWWTCDTSTTGQSCDFSVSASVATGTIGNLDTTELAGGSVTTPTASRVDARVTTSTEVHGLTFTTNAGAVLTVQASVGGIQDGSFLFFVQDGKVNGGYAGPLTNPLQLQGSTP
jgi:hypothetical protein